MKRIIAAFIIIINIMTYCVFTSFAFYSENEKENSQVEFIEDNNTVIQINNFKDSNLMNYNMNELQSLIDAEKADQKAAHNLANLARQLNWGEKTDPIVSAKAEWWNSKLAIDIYQARYNELYQELEIDKWINKKTEYPVATEIWLYMKDLGWNDYVCAGIMGNLMAEVGGQTLDIQYWLQGNGYYGMCQWNKAYRSKVWGADLAGQCDFLRDTIKYEIDTFGYAYQKGFNFNSFLNMSNERDVAKAFAKCYERCGSSTYAIRMNNAEKAYNYFVNN